MTSKQAFHSLHLSVHVSKLKTQHLCLDGELEYHEDWLCLVSKSPPKLPMRSRKAPTPFNGFSSFHIEDSDLERTSQRFKNIFVTLSESLS